MARALLAAGVGPQDHVAFIDMNGPEYFEVLFGCAKINAINVGVNWRLAPAEMAYTINDAEAKALFVGPDFQAAIGQVRQDLTGVRTVVNLGDEYEAWLGGADADPEAQSDPGDVAIQLYTSGTTGLPKGAMITNFNLETLITQVLADWEFDSDSVNLVASPLFNIAGGGWALVGMYCGATTVLLRAATPPTLLQAIAEQRVTNALLVPALLNFMLQVPGVEDRLLVAAGDRLRRLADLGEGARAVDQHLQVPLHPGLRADRAHGVGHHPASRGARPRQPRAAALLWPPPQLGIAPDRRSPVGCGQSARRGGEIWLKSGQVMKGYWNRPEATAETITPDGWLRTGDLAYADADGYVYLQDRVKDMIISGGQNVYPVEVENVLMAHPAIADVAVIGVPDEQWGETVKAIVVRKPDQEPDGAAIIAFARERIAHFKAPTSVDFADALPRNPSGKVLKRELREPYWAGLERRIN